MPRTVRKHVFILKVRRSAPAPPTPPVFRVLLYHPEASGRILLRCSVSTVSTLAVRNFYGASSKMN